MKHTHSGQLARWLGEEKIAQVSVAMRDFYWPVALSGVPGNVMAMPGGDFTGEIRAGYEMTARDRLEAIYKRTLRGYRRACRPNARVAAGFASLSDLIYEVTTNGKRQEPAFYKVGTTGVVSGTNSLWRVGSHPAAGSAASAAPGGNAPTSATTGALIFSNPSGGDYTSITTAQPMATVVANTLLLYDRIFQVAKTMNSSATELVTGVPTRYTSTTPSDPNYAGGNFLFPECGTVLPATAHNWTVCKYTPQSGGSPDSILPSSTGNSANIVNRLDLPLGTWFFPLQAGDTGILSLTQMQCSALVATGAIDFVIGHPLAFLPCPIANMCCTYDGINTAFSLSRVFDSACLAFLEIMKPATGATSYSGTVTLAAG